MRKRKNADFDISVYKFWCEPKESVMPEVVWRTAKAMQGLWNELCARLEEAKKVGGEGKLDWKLFNETAKAAVRASGLNWEQGPAVMDRFLTTCRRLGKGGGWPRPQRRLTNFLIPHRFTAGGCEVARLCSESSKRFRLRAVSDEAYEANTRDRCRERFTAACFGLDGQEVWLNTILHRRIPENAIVKQVGLCGEDSSIGKWNFSLVITVETPPAPSSSRSPSMCSIDLGWRKFEDHLRIGLLFDPQTKGFEELKLMLAGGNSDTRRMGIPDSWQSLAEYDAKIALRLERAKAAVKALLEQSTDPELKSRLQGFHMVRQGGLRRLRRDVSNGCDVELLRALNDWALDHDRLRRLKYELESRLIGRRRWHYQNLANTICRCYSILVWEKDLGLKEMSEEEDLAPALKKSAQYRKWAAIYELRKWIRNAAKKHSTQIIEADPGYTSTTCWVCGAQTVNSGKLVLTCPNGHSWDQDENAARNLITQILLDMPQDLGFRNSRKASQA